jgi:hypothetical protein
MAADANSVDEMMNSPEIKPTRPEINTAAVKISFCRSFMGKLSYKVKSFLNYRLTIQNIFIVDNNTWYIWIVSILDTLDSLYIHKYGASVGQGHYRSKYLL